nr:hypothetical protein [uncultured Cohaesibacter sp.]
MQDGDPITAALIGEERLEWSSSPNWFLAEKPQSKRTRLWIAFIATCLTSAVSVLYVAEKTSLADGNPNRPVAVAIMAALFSVTGYSWLHLTRTAYDLRVRSLTEMQTCYALTNKRLLVFSDGKSELLISNEKYQLSSAVLQPNGLVHDLELVFESKNRSDKASVVGPILLHAISNAETLKDTLVAQFSMSPLPYSQSAPSKQLG